MGNEEKQYGYELDRPEVVVTVGAVVTVTNDVVAVSGCVVVTVACVAVVAVEVVADCGVVVVAAVVVAGDTVVPRKRQRQKCRVT